MSLWLYIYSRTDVEVTDVAVRVLDLCEQHLDMSAERCKQSRAKQDSDE